QFVDAPGFVSGKIPTRRAIKSAAARVNRPIPSGYGLRLRPLSTATDKGPMVGGGSAGARCARPVRRRGGLVLPLRIELRTQKICFCWGIKGISSQRREILATRIATVSAIASLARWRERAHLLVFGGSLLRRRA